MRLRFRFATEARTVTHTCSNLSVMLKISPGMLSFVEALESQPQEALTAMHTRSNLSVMLNIFLRMLYLVEILGSHQCAMLFEVRTNQAEIGHLRGITNSFCDSNSRKYFIIMSFSLLT